MDIFCRLPIKCLIDCRCICKAWRDLILDPRFARLHLPWAPTMFMLHFGNLESGTHRNIYMVEPEPCCDDAITKVNLGDERYVKIIGLCKSLLCLRDLRSRKSLYISNAMTGESMTLPKINNYREHLLSGFGFSLNTNKYKVIRMICTWHCINDPSSYRQFILPKWEAEIHTVGTETWRCIGNIQYDFPCFCHYKLTGTFLNGALHWIARVDNASTLICAFDIGNEQFQTILPPPFSFSERGHAIDWANLGVIGGCLYICACEDADYHSAVEIWVMKDYGVKESWMKALVIKDIQWQPKGVGPVNRWRPPLFYQPGFDSSGSTPGINF
ncbi:hypothetical protein L1049_023944 [Liquidambar formosana]|uniref:F-box protein n=1 Tax=Liquidambar formosana TaxID=63359 RepID=A0AAP0WZ49_LIQFO